jgi:L-ribulose-5-phosphate 3-epimerase
LPGDVNAGKHPDHSLESFRPLLDGTTDWPAVVTALDQIGYRGYCTFEYFHPYQHYPEALIYQTSDALDRLLGRPLPALCRRTK